MKRKEREHLKEDPFQVFIEKVIDLLRKYKKQIYVGLTAVVTVIVILLVVLFFRSTSVDQTQFNNHGLGRVGQFHRDAIYFILLRHPGKGERKKKNQDPSISQISHDASPHSLNHFVRRI